MDGATPTLEGLTAAVDAELGEYLAGRRAALPEGDLLIDEVQRLLAAGGKRLRPSFCYWGYRSAGGPHCQEIIRAATSLELLHTFAIVHDDIMDRSDERRGEPTVHIKHGNEVALLVGDLSLVLADDAFFRSGFRPEILQRAFSAYSRMRQEVIAGQFLDMRSSSAEVDASLARRIAVLKSGRYSIREPLVIGATLGRAEQGLIDQIAAFGEPLGEAFQLRDDLLGLFGDRSSLGKSIDSDIREGKKHLLFAFTVEGLPDDRRELFLRRWGAGGSLSGAEVEQLRGMVEKSGARARAEEHLGILRRGAARLLEGLEVPEEAKQALAKLSARATHRRS